MSQGSSSALMGVLLWWDTVGGAQLRPGPPCTAMNKNPALRPGLSLSETSFLGWTALPSVTLRTPCADQLLAGAFEITVFNVRGVHIDQHVFPVSRA